MFWRLWPINHDIYDLKYNMREEKVASDRKHFIGMQFVQPEDVWCHLELGGCTYSKVFILNSYQVVQKKNRFTCRRLRDVPTIVGML